MSESLYRRNPENNVIEKVIKPRRGLLNQQQTINGKSASMRNPSWVSITGHDMSCGGGGKKTYPDDKDKIQTAYNYSGGSIKPGPDVESVIIDYGGDWGLARKITGRIRCYKITDFEIVQKYFLLPGNEIDVEFGYAQKSWGYDSNKELTGFKVATFSFNATQDGHWICEFTAVSSAEAIKNLDMQIVVCNGCNDGTGQSGISGPLKYLVFNFGGGSTPHPVKGVAQLIASDAQKNGQTSIDDLKDGEVITLTNYSPGSKDKSAAIVIYTGDHIRNQYEKFTAWIGSIAKYLGVGQSEVDSANNQVYLTLGYIVNRIINDQLLKAMGCGVVNTNKDRDKFNKLKIEFHEKYSKCKIAKGITSGDPLTCLLLGDANYKNNDGEGKDFDGDCKNLGAVKSNNGGDIKLQNILLHRDVVVSAFNDATQKREANSDQTDVKDVKDEVVNVVDFFEKIADHISSATGGAIALRLVENPDDLKSVIVVDQNYGVSEKLQCVVFDPIDGDGSTRSCEVQSNVGSQEYKAAMFVGSSIKGDAISALRNCGPDLKQQRQQEYDKAKTDKDALIKNPGNLGKNQFDGQEINALKSVMGRLYRNNPDSATMQSIHYPGLSISLEIDGCWGFTPGNAISTTQVPKNYRDVHSYFMVRSVVHTFQQSDWSTKIDGILAYYPNIEYIPL